MGTHFFIDETKAKSYVVVAGVCPDESLSAARRTIGRLVLPGQRSFHMKHESPRRRRQIADAISDLRNIGVCAVVLDAGRGPEPEHARRERALRGIVGRATHVGVASLVLDLDRTLVAKDARTITDATRELGATSLSFSHLRYASEPLLAIPDVIAWCWARGGDWRGRMTPVIAEVTKV